jgi:fluoride exporter
MDLVAILVGGALGGMARFGLADAVGRRIGGHFPWGMLLVNASGTLLIGVAAAVAMTATEHHPSMHVAWQLGAVGFLGSYTTVSSFSLQTLAMMHDRQWKSAAANTLLSLVLCLGGAAAGLWLGGHLIGSGA